MLDSNDEDIKTGLISFVSKDTDGVVTCFDDHRHGLVDGDHVSFIEVTGMTELNHIEPRKVTVTGKMTKEPTIYIFIKIQVACCHAL